MGPRVVFCYRYGLLGGVSAQLLNRYSYLSSFLDVSVLYERDHGMASRFPAGAAQVVSTMAAQTEAIRILRPDVVVVIDSPGFVEAWRAAGKPGKLVLEVHTTTANVGYLRQPQQFAEVSHIVTVSKYMETLLREHDLHHLAPISVVPNCLDDRWREPSSATPLEGHPVLWVGKLDSHKRWRTAVDIIDQLSEAPDLRVLPILIGGVTSPESEVLALTTRLATSTGLARGVWFPRLEYDRMPELYSAVGRSHGVHLSTTLNESFGMAVAESVLRGCPVIAPDVGALPELLPAAALYPPDGWATAREKARRAMTDMEFCEEILSSTDHVRELTRPERVVEAYRNVVAAVLADDAPHDVVEAGQPV